MRWLCKSHIARLAAAIFAVVTISGCPQLNYWNGPSQDPFFSVADPLATPKAAPGPAAMPAQPRLHGSTVSPAP